MNDGTGRRSAAGLHSSSVRLDILKVVATGIASAIPLGRTIEVALQLVAGRFPGRTIAFGRLRSDGSAILTASFAPGGAPSLGGREVPLPRHPAVLDRLRAGEAAIVEDAEADPSPWSGGEDLAALGFRAAALLPVGKEGAPSSVLLLGSATPRRWTDEEVSHLSEVVDFLSMAVEDARGRAEREKAETALRESREQFRQIAENIREVFWLGDPSRTRLLYVSPRFEEIWGRPLAGLMETPLSWFDAIHPADRDRVVRAAVERRPGDDYDETYRILRPDGAIRWIHERAFPVRDDAGRVWRLAGLAEDVTAHHEAEEAMRLQDQRLRMAQKMEAIGQLAGGVAHDFNNLLVAILGFSELVMDAMDEEDPLRRQVGEIRSAGQKAADLTRQLLAFGRRQMIAPIVMDPNPQLRGMEGLLRRVIEEDIDLVLQLEPDAGRVRIDPTQLEQVVMNLAVNARDAMPRGGSLVIETAAVRLDEGFAGAHPGSRAGPQLMLAVSDTGVGMSPETQARIFEPFFTTKPEGKGTGLGLATVYGIAKQNDWYLTVYSEVGKGTTFKIFIPRIEDAAAAPAGGPGESASLRGTETILVAEDDAVVRKLVVSVLRDYGYRVLETRVPEDAAIVAHAFDGPIHLLLSDVVMPRVSGPDVAREVRSRRPDVRVLFMSGYTDRVMSLQGIDPAFPFIQKPFAPRALAKRVRMVLDG